MEPKELAAAVLKQITEHPETHDQGVWFEAPNVFGDRVSDVIHVLNMPEGACDTTACVAGWAVFLAYKEGQPDSWNHEYIGAEAERLLNLTFGEAEWLFSVNRFKDEIVDALQRIVEGQPVLAELQ